MIRVLGGEGRTCQGPTRREVLRAGGLGLLGEMTLPQLAAARTRVARSKSVIFINLLGGPSHLDMFDPKPDAPADIRGEFNAIETSLSGLRICEHMPKIARTMRQSTLIRTITHGYNAHNPLNILTGFSGGEFAQVFPKATDPPSMGAVCQYLGMGRKDMPTHAVLPCYPGWGEQIRRPGPYGGFLGAQYDPLIAVVQPAYGHERKRDYYDAVQAFGTPRIEGFDSIPSLTVDRLDRRRSLVTQVDDGIRRIAPSPAVATAGKFEQQAFELLTSGKVRDAFDLEREPASVRDRYGKDLYARSMLLARRLVEAGVVFVTVSWEVLFKNGIAFDTHEANFDALKRVLLPSLDHGYTTLIQDLSDRGLLDETLVVVMGEMGRSPRINKAAGRDHWPQCGFALLTGGGVVQGTVYGRSDETGSYPTEDPVTPADLACTLYELLGIDPETMVPDPQGRPMPISHGGQPIRRIIG